MKKHKKIIAILLVIMTFLSSFIVRTENLQQNAAPQLSGAASTQTQTTEDTATDDADGVITGIVVVVIVIIICLLCGGSASSA